MGWIQEGKKVMNEKYSTYYKICRKIGEEPIPFYQFDLKCLKMVKEQLKLLKEE